MIEQTWLKGSGCLPRANTTSVNVRMWPVPVTSSPPKAWSKVMMGIWPPTAASYRNCDPPNFPCPGCAEKILKLCRTYQDVQVWGSSHMVWSTGLGPTDNDASPSNSLTVSFIYIYILYYYMYIVSKHWRQMPTNYLVVLPKFHKANRFSHDLNCQKGLSGRRRTRAFGRLKGSRWLQNPRWFPLKKWWDTIRSYMNTRAGRKPEWCLKQRKNIDMICANQRSSTKWY